MNDHTPASFKAVHKENRRFKITILLLVAILLISLILSMSIGAMKIPASSVYKIILHNLFGISTGDTAFLSQGANFNIVWQIRFPRVLLGFITGSGLALSGAIMQASVQNPLAEPYILGISSGATLGATFSIMLGVGAIGLFPSGGIAFWAFLGAIGATAAVLMLSSMGGKPSSSKLVLSGTVINALCGSLSNYIISVASNAEGIQTVKFWTMGSLAAAKWETLPFPAAVVLICCLFFLFQPRILNTMLIGDEAAITLGINLNFYRKLYMTITAFLIGVLVSVCGIIGFVGLIIPHISRSIVGTDHRKLMPFCILLGGLFMIWADAYARIAIPGGELSIGIVTSLVGAPFFVYILIRKNYGFKG